MDAQQELTNIIASAGKIELLLIWLLGFHPFPHRS